MDRRSTDPPHHVAVACSHPTRRPYVQIGGSGGTVIRASRSSLVVCRCNDRLAEAGSACREWPYEALSGMRLDAYGPLGVLRATLGLTEVDLPLLLLDPDQIAPARRALELVENLMAVHQEARQSA